MAEAQTLPESNTPAVSVTTLSEPTQNPRLPLEDTSLPESIPVTMDVLKTGLSKTTQAELSLEEALEMALEANLDVKIQEDKTQQAKARYYTRLATMLPDVDFNFQRQDYGGALQVFGNNVIDIDRRIQQPAMIFKFPVFKGGKDWFQVRAAKRQLMAQEAAEAGQEEAILRQTAVQYYELKRRLSDVKIAQKQLDEVQATLDLNQTRMDAGVGTRLEVAQTKAQLAQTQQLVLNALQAAQLAALNLNETLNLPALVDVVPDTEEQLKLVTLVNKQWTTPELLAQAQQHRKELQTIQKQIDALKELRKLSMSAFVPDVTFQIGLGQLGPSLHNASGYTDARYGLDLNLTDLGVPALTLLKENNAKMNELMHQLEAKQRGIEKEIAQAYLDTVNKEALIAQAKVQLEASSVALSDALDRLKLGVGRNIDVLDAETRLTEARQNYVAAVMQYNQAQVNLVAAIGQASVEHLTEGVSAP